ncbi:tyrosine-type recombinase/integrase [Dyella sp. 2RAF44]|uniref:tyrosine-type recombinase/integrase n=1 Tax=Dyella sp. 2RAF44 TaxID=3233000 RepID=UPI003F907636
MATVYWRGKTAYLNWRHAGQQYRVSLGKITEREAESYRQAKQVELEHGVKILNTLPTVRQFFEYYEKWYAKTHKATAKKIITELKSFRATFDSRHIDSIRPVEIENWKAERLVTHAAETVGKELRRVKTAFKLGMQWEELDTNPVASVKAPRGVRSVAVKFYQAEAMQALYKAAPAFRGHLWAFAANTGLRRGELAKATKDDVIDYARGEQRIRVESIPDEVTDKGRTKSARWREVPLNKAAKDALKHLPHRLAGGAHADTLTEWFTEDAKAAEIGGTLHRLRHTFCSHLVMAGVSLRRVQLLAGHADQKTTEMYAHLAPEGASDAVDAIDFAPKKAQRKHSSRKRASEPA